MLSKKYDIIRTIERYVTLRIKGDKATGLCPFHDDHTPSLQVDIRKQRFVCYACGEWGDAISFVRKLEKCSFPEALRILDSNPSTFTSKLNNTPMKTNEKKPEKKPVNHNILLSQLMPYSTGDNRLSEIYLDFEVGIAPSLLPHPWKGLAGRLVFPVRDETGKLRGFAGRRLTDNPGSPKYFNTTAESGFKRSEILYGLHRALKTIQLTGIVYITEGYKDTLAMHAAGFTNTIGLCGTEITSRQTALISKYAKRAVVLLDGDEAGYKASVKVSEALLNEKIEVFTVQFPQGEDPDSLFRKIIIEDFIEIIKHSTYCGSPIEVRLMTLLFMFPDLQYNKQKTFAEAFHELLISERITPVGYRYDEIISYISKQGSAEGLSEKITAGLFAIMPDARRGINDVLSSTVQKGLLSYEEAVLFLVKTLLLVYFRERATEYINEQTRKVKFVASDKERDEILKEIKYRNNQLQQIAQHMKILCDDYGTDKKISKN